MRSILTLGFAAAVVACGGDAPAPGSATLAAAPPGASSPEASLAPRSLGGSSLSRLQLLATPAGRAAFARVVACALPAGAALTAIASDGTPYRFVGGLGLAAGWAARPATAAERHQVARCLHAPVRGLAHASPPTSLPAG